MDYMIWCTYHDNSQIAEYDLKDDESKHFKIFNGAEKHDGYDIYYANKYINEFCTQYYVWKNNIKSDIVGFCHYRRQHFMTNEILNEINNNKYYAFEKYKHDFTFNQKYNYDGLGYHIDKLREYIKNKYPNKVDKFDYIFNSTSEVWFCYREIYFCKWEVFDMIMDFVDGYIKFLFNDNRELYEYSEKEYDELTYFLNNVNWSIREDYAKEHNMSFDVFFGAPRCLAFMCEFIIAFLFEFFDEEIKGINKEIINLNDLNKIFFICMSSNKERVNNVNNVVKQLHIEHLADIHYTDKLEQLYDEDDICKSLTKFFFIHKEYQHVINSFSCFLNHYNIICEAYYLNYDYILVCEDDIHVIDNDKFLSLLNNIPSNADFIQYEYNKETYPDNSDQNITYSYNEDYNIIKNISTCSAQCMFLSKKMIHKIFNYYKKYKLVYADQYQYDHAYKYPDFYDDINIYVPKEKILQNWTFKSEINI